MLSAVRLVDQDPLQSSKLNFLLGFEPALTLVVESEPFPEPSICEHWLKKGKGWLRHVSITAHDVLMFVLLRMDLIEIKL